MLEISAADCTYEHGILTRWGPSALLQKALYGEPRDGYTVFVERAHACVSDVFLHHKTVRAMGSGGVGTIKRTHPLFVGHWGGNTAGQVVLQQDDATASGADAVQVAVSQVCRSFDIAVVPEQIPVLLLPLPLSLLVTCKAVRDVLLLVRWHSALHEHRHRSPSGPLPEWPPQAAEVWQRCRQADPRCDADALVQVQCQEPNFKPLTADTLADFASQIRSWAPALLNEPAGSSAPATAKQDMQVMLSTLDSWALSWRQAAGLVVPTQASRFRHTARKLLDCIRLGSYLLGGPSKLADVITQSLAIALPEFLREPFVRSLKKGQGVPDLLPSPSLLQRYELALDAALMLLAREKSSDRCVRVGWTDSSPLAGYDWIWSQQHEIAESMLIPCFQAVCNLANASCNLVREHEQLEEDGGAETDLPTAPLPEWRPWLQMLKQGIHEHIHPPAALGSGHRSLADKAASEVFKWHLQNRSPDKLPEYSRSFVAHCSDMGVEVGLPDFQLKGSVSTMLPPWVLEKHALGEELDLGVEQEQPLSAGPSDVDQCDLDGQFLNDDDADAAARVDVVQPVVAEAVDANVQASSVFFMPEALTIAGLQHIVNNLCSDVHQNMSHCTSFHGDLKSLEALLRVDERRQRFIWTCLQNSALEGQSFRFRQFSGALYEGRWHQVLQFLRAVKPLLSTLARAWDAEKYIRGVNSEGLARPAQAQAERGQNERQGLVALDPARITVALRCPLFHSYVSMALALEEIPEQLATAAESCVCHRALLSHLSEHKKRKCVEEHYGDAVKVCPLAGKLLPELVAGELEDVFSKICATRESDLRMLALPGGLEPLSADQWNILIADFRKGPAGFLLCPRPYLASPF